MSCNQIVNKGSSSNEYTHTDTDLHLVGNVSAVNRVCIFYFLVHVNVAKNTQGQEYLFLEHRVHLKYIKRVKCVVMHYILTRFRTVSTMSLLLTSPTWIRPMRTANFILIFRIGTEGLITPAGRTIEPAPDTIISPVTAPVAACCPWPEGGSRSESKTEPGTETGFSLDISSQIRRSGRCFTCCVPPSDCAKASRSKGEKRKCLE